MPIDVLKTKAQEVTLPLAHKKHERKLHYYDRNRRIKNKANLDIRIDIEACT
jgi:hypothetical protein